MNNAQLRNIPEYIKPYFDELSQFQYYYEYEKSVKLRRDIDDKFICLKGFSSSTPIINSATFGRECMGGGFYFRYKDHGIALDPGMGFTSLMHRNNIFINDIDTVIVTHSHIDHNSDVGVLSALKYDYDKNKSRDRGFFEEFFKCSKNEPNKITWYMDEETIKATQSILDSERVHSLSDYCDNTSAVLSNNIDLSVIRTRHVRGNDQTYGIKLNFHSDEEMCKWGYTSDTCYYEELKAFFSGVDVLIFNISDIYRSDVAGKKYKNSHLGFNGSLTLLKDTLPRVALASEFCCMNGDYRYETVKALRESGKVCVIPADPGLMMDVGAQRIKCSICGKSACLDSIRIIHPSREFGDIQYVCPDCIL